MKALFFGLLSVVSLCSYAEGFVLPGKTDFVTVPGGTFIMGCLCEEGSGCSCEYPIREVAISSFELMTCEVSQSLWATVTGSNPSMFIGDSLPVECVSWQMSCEFIDELNRLDSSYDYRLPTESEWEYACRGGTETPFHWGNSCSDSILGVYCWCGCNSGGHSHGVGSGEANPIGLYNMNGNVWEWCMDTYHDSYTGAPCTGEEWSSSEGQGRVARGGSWLMDPEECRASFRIHADEDFSNQLFGLRLVRFPVEYAGSEQIAKN